jgi:hypothetical protein
MGAIAWGYCHEDRCEGIARWDAGRIGAGIGHRARCPVGRDPNEWGVDYPKQYACGTINATISPTSCAWNYASRRRCACASDSAAAECGQQRTCICAKHHIHAEFWLKAQHNNYAQQHDFLSAACAGNYTGGKRRAAATALQHQV